MSDNRISGRPCCDCCNAGVVWKKLRSSLSLICKYYLGIINGKDMHSQNGTSISPKLIVYTLNETLYLFIWWLSKISMMKPVKAVILQWPIESTTRCRNRQVVFWGDILTLILQSFLRVATSLADPAILLVLEMYDI